MVILTLNPSFPGKWIWTLDMLPKIQYFLWKCFLHSIPTKDILESRGLVGDVKCQSQVLSLNSSSHKQRLELNTPNRIRSPKKGEVS
ncbi:hypothetical protein CFP56_039216 [Quercus suber]|uniref:Reverse transcriptase zinc-binding domain-containing protein n=1 Tax=Quercus suber TaxID=58331 RepID=A0AAW0J0X7_QUESU